MRYYLGVWDYKKKSSELISPNVFKLTYGKFTICLYDLPTKAYIDILYFLDEYLFMYGLKTLETKILLNDTWYTSTLANFL